MKAANNIILEASSFRKKYNVDEYAPINLKEIINSIEDITFIEKKMSQGISGMYMNISDKSNIIVINTNATKGRQNFSIAHELYHYLHKNIDVFITFKEIDKNSEEEELKADLFATNLLIPQIALHYYFNEVYKDDSNLIKIMKIEHYFGISRKALLIRLKNEELITTSEFHRYQKNVMAEAIKNGFTTDIYKINENLQDKISGQYLRYVNEMFEKEKISDSKRIELLMDAFYYESIEGNEDIAID